MSILFELRVYIYITLEINFFKLLIFFMRHFFESTLNFILNVFKPTFLRFFLVFITINIIRNATMRRVFYLKYLMYFNYLTNLLLSDTLS